MAHLTVDELKFMNTKYLLFILSFLSLFSVAQTQPQYSEAAEEYTEYRGFCTVKTLGNYTIVKKGSQVGVYHKASKAFAIPPKYEKIRVFNKKDTIFIATYSKFEQVTEERFNQKITTTKKIKKQLLLDKHNKALSKTYNDIDYIHQLAVSIVENSKGEHYMLNANLQNVTPTPYQSLYTKYFGDSKIIVAKQKGKYGIIDKNNTILIPIIYDDILHTYEDRLIVSMNEKVKIINLKNEVILDTDFQDISKLDYNNNHLVQKRFKKGVMDRQGNILIPVKYSEIRIRNSFNAYFVIEDKKNGYYKIGLYDKHTKLRIPTVYDHLTVVSHKHSKNHSKTNRFIAKKDGKYGVIDLDNNSIIDHKYKSIRVLKQHEENTMLPSLIFQADDPKKQAFIKSFFKGYVYEAVIIDKGTFFINEKDEKIKVN